MFPLSVLCIPPPSVSLACTSSVCVCDSVSLTLLIGVVGSGRHQKQRCSDCFTSGALSKHHDIHNFRIMYLLSLFITKEKFWGKKERETKNENEGEERRMKRDDEGKEN